MPLTYTTSDPLFEMVGAQARAKAALTNAANPYPLTVRAQNAKGWFKDKTFDITIPAEATLWGPQHLQTAPLLWWEAWDAASVTRDGSNLVSQITNKGSGAASPAQADSTKRPTYVAASIIGGAPGISFSGGKSLFGNVAHTGAALAGFQVARLQSFNSFQRFLSMGNGTAGDYDDVTRTALLATGDAVGHRTERGWTTTPQQSLSVDFPYIGATLHSNGSGYTRKNGVSGTVTSFPAGNFNIANYAIGRQASGENDFMIGTISAQIVLGYTPDAATINRIEGYLAHMSNTEDQLDSGHPYRNNPPLL